ncbi:hypothetical protein SSP24_00060 [Streptomyces spinoverrucosus]|uniref:Uncharacterized protein n=1 Tax=Streptomyces spinoverrucosus TaxID=284043 RepID=A0A4Y3V9Y4_9ACTN|nr:hypothetical protein [Streptomyces spinoverrucosus]GEC02351.1 hypothetical protein SSP24_00060 [Streptomyces spinoverrucosus]GHB43598.1 hypothetical protein GCM10010397_12530 [Streptomyces spinoverrucosus]
MAAGQSASEAKQAASDAKKIVEQKRQDEIAAESARAAEEARYNKADGIDPANTAANDMVTVANAEPIRNDRTPGRRSSPWARSPWSSVSPPASRPSSRK